MDTQQTRQEGAERKATEEQKRRTRLAAALTHMLKGRFNIVTPPRDSSRFRESSERPAISLAACTEHARWKPLAGKHERIFQTHNYPDST